jgi:hypothetical protein
VGKHIAITIFFLDEAKSFSTVKPLDFTVSHVSPFKLVFVIRDEEVSFLKSYNK